MKHRAVHRRAVSHSAAQQRGAALLMAMIIVTLVASLAAAMIWQQWRAVQVEAAERARVQSAWVLSGALDFARLILKEDLQTGRPTALTEPWATPLEESRLSTFLAVDKSNADDGPEAFLSGNITDAQGRYNLNNLAAAPGTPQAQVELDTFTRLCEKLNLDASVPILIANGLRSASGVSTNGTPSAASPLQPGSVAQLIWLGVDPASVEALKPYVAILPPPTKVNVNTAPMQVLEAILNLPSLGTIESKRRVTPYKDLPTFFTDAGASPTLTTQLTTQLDVKSQFFDVRGRIRLDDHVLVERSLVQRFQTGQITVLFQERIAGLDQVGG